MTITDTGPIVAIINDADGNHIRCRSALSAIRAPLITTHACFTEAMYLLKRDSGLAGQMALWNMIEKQGLVIADITPAMLKRSRELMVRYSDIPCDYADATLLALAEQISSRRIFTIDSHFHAYRLSRGRVVEVLP